MLIKISKWQGEVQDYMEKVENGYKLATNHLALP